MSNIIPLPARMEERPGFFKLTPSTCIVTDEAGRPNAQVLHDLLAHSTGYSLETKTGGSAGKNVIYLHLDQTLARLGDEGYCLEVQDKTIGIRASAPAGIFHGIQSLRQLLPLDVELRHLVDVDGRIPCVLIEDKPRFSWRGFMLDEGRHFHGKQTVLRILDLMAMLKLNIFHWHLTEDQGWRIDVRKYPRLTQIGSWRAGTSETMLGRKHDGIPHGGFYSQEDIREIVAYAAERQVVIVPEIEIPGHSLAALASYPELSCTGGPFEVATHFGIFPDIYCAGKETVFTFLEDVLDEIIVLFPSPIIHIGGDEVPKIRWKKCPDCQKRIRSEGLKDEHALQLWFTNRIAQHLESRGRRLMGWNQILKAGLASSAVIHFWLGNRKKLVNASRQEHRQVVMSSYLDTYLDHGYALMPLSRAYRYEPVPRELADTGSTSVLGLEFPLWTEWVPNRARLDYQVFPRLCAMAETGWTPRDRKDLTDFRRRLELFQKWLDQLGVNHAHLKDVEPSKWKQRFGVFTIIHPQSKMAERTS